MKLTKGYLDRLDRILTLAYEPYDSHKNKVEQQHLEHNLLKIKSHCEIMLAWIELSKKAEE
jgi:hypothetical protein